ncbi:TcpQ domain-containing protein [uncultured Desulfovibrio sp.]|uniref:TcpQ domain-containing protein n=1 Tax=uncultured Desulfovibrio sp. TaxID=167968 RepID=UPI0026099267|nr:TcpQ domain-containing protein [uncultured Desulfovibrio sp.]
MKKVLVPLFCLLCAACVTHRNASGSFDGLSAAYTSDAQALAIRAAEELSRRHAPAHTSVALQKVPGLFGDALESGLRSRGFALAQSGSSLGVAYRVDAVQTDQGAEPSLGYVQVGCTDGQLFSFTRPLGSPVPYTEPPNTRPVPEDHPLESRPLPESVPQPMPTNALSAQTATPVRKYTVKKTGTAAAVAKRCGIPVRDFCRWNQVGSNAVLEKGYEVYLSEPPAGVIPVAATVPVPAGASEEPSAATTPAPMPEPVSLPSRAQTSPALRLGKPKPGEPVAYTPVALNMPAAQTPKPAGAPIAEAPVTVPASTPAPSTSSSLMPVAAIEAVPVAQALWDIRKGSMLRGQMEGWAAVAGYSLIWNAQNDYEMRSSATFSGEFIDAVKNFFAALQANGLALRVTIYQGNKVMEVSEH